MGMRGDEVNWENIYNKEDDTKNGELIEFDEFKNIFIELTSSNDFERLTDAIGEDEELMKLEEGMTGFWKQK